MKQLKKFLWFYSDSKHQTQLLIKPEDDGCKQCWISRKRKSAHFGNNQPECYHNGWLIVLLSNPISQEYAVRGPIVLRAVALEKELAKAKALKMGHFN